MIFLTWEIGKLANLITGVSSPTATQGGVTMAGLTYNVGVGVGFIHSWLAEGRGTFVYQGGVEDSATAEISRSQVWQWIRQEAGACASYFCTI